MFRRARLSVKPNVRPGVGARCSTAPNPQRGKVSHPQRGKDALRPPEPAATCDPKPAEPTNVPLVDIGRAEPQKEAPRSSDEKTDGENDVEESSKFSSSVSQRRKRISSTPTLVKPSINVPSEPHPLSTVNQEAPQPIPIPTKEKRPYSDRHRIYKAQKLREMLKEELRREKQWKNKYAINESQRPQDRSKMTMRDFIYYLPDKNPMTSSLEQEKKTEKSLIPVQTREQEDRSTSDPEDNEELEEEMDDGPLLVPRVKVAEDGSIILDEESLTVEVLRTKGSCVVEDNDPIFERGSTTTYSSFRKNYYSKPWSNKETDMFFLAISMVGTDFSMIGQLFPHRARIEIKNKFKREEKTNGWRIDKAFQEKRPFDFDFFAHLLQKVLAEEEKRKQKSIKNQSLKEKKSSKAQKTVKVKNVATEGVNDNPDESVSANISDTEESQNDAQTVQEEQEQPLMLSGEDSEQIALEPELSQKKRRRKNRDEVGKEEIKNFTENATVQPGPSKGEKQKNKSQSLRLEVNEDEGNTKQKLSCAQNISELVDVSSSDEVVNSSDPVLSSRKTDQTENIKPMAREQLQRPKHNLSRTVGKKLVLSQGKTDTRSKSLHPETSVEKVHMEKERMDSFDISEMENSQSKNSEADTVSNLSEQVSLQKDDPLKAFRPSRLMSSRQQRLQPNVGQVAERKEILASQEEIGANVEKNESESCSDRDTPRQIEDLSCNSFECEGIIISQSEENYTSFQTMQPDEPKCVNECLSTQEDNKANILKPVPVLKSRFQKPKPNIGRRTRRRGISSKEEVPEVILLASGEKTAARVETSPKEKVPGEANSTKEVESESKETGRGDSSPREKIPALVDITVGIETDLKETERKISPRDEIPGVTGAIEEIQTDLAETGSEISLQESAPEEVSTAEVESDLAETERNKLSLQESAPEVSTAGEVETGLKETGREISPRDEIPEVTGAIEEIQTDLAETGSELSLQESAPKVSTAGEVESDLAETGRNELSLQESAPEVSTAGEVESHLAETERNELSLQESAPEVSTAGEVESDLAETERNELSLQESALEVSTAGEVESDLSETERNELSLQESAPEVSTAGEVESHLAETERNELSLQESTPEVSTAGEVESDLAETERNELSLQESAPEVSTAGEVESDLAETERNELSLQESAPEVSTAGEVESDLAETERNELSLQESAPEVSTAGEVESDLAETERNELSLQENAPEVSTAEEVESDLAETERNELSLQESAPEVSTAGEVESDLAETGREISPREKIPEVTGTIEEIQTDLAETERNELSLQESAPEISTAGEVESDLKETGREISPREKIPEVTGATEEIQTDLAETERNELSLQESAPKEVSTAGEVKKDLKEIEKEIPSRQNVLVGISAIQEREINLKENGKRDISLMEKVSEKMAAIRVTETDLKETGRRISLHKSGSEEISATEEMVADLKKTGTDICLRENEPKKTGTSLQTETDLIQSSGADCSTVPSLNIQNISSEVLSVVHTTVEEKRNSEMKPSSSLSHLKTSLQTSEIDKIEDQGTRSTGVPEQFSDINLSKSHQEQKPSEVKPAPFVRSRFKKPKPNLSRAAVKRVTTDAEKHVPGKKLEMDEVVSTVIQQDDEQMNTLSFQRDVSSLMTSRGKDKSSHRQEEAVILSCVQTEKILSPSSSCEANESQSTLDQEKESLVSVGTLNIDTFQQERKESVTQTSRPVRGRLQRPRPNIRKAGQRQMIEKGEAKGISKEEKTILQKDEAKKFMTVENSEIGTEIEVVSSKVPEGRMYKNQNHVALVENLHVNKINVLDKKMRHEDNVYVRSPAQLIRRQYQEAKPNLGRAHDKKEEQGIEKDRANQSEARKPEDNLLQQGDSVTQLLQKGKEETSLEVPARKDYVVSKEAGLAKKDGQSEVGPSGSVGPKTVGDNSLSSVVEEQHLGKLASHLQLLKQSNYFKIAPNRRTANSSTSGCVIHRSERRMHRNKPNVNKGRGAKRIRSKTSKKEPRASRTTLVTLRASQEEYEDDVEDFESDYEEETYHLAPEEVNKAPVFVPVGLRSPEPVSAQIEETMEELEITVNAPDIGFITVDEHQLSNTDVTSQEMKQGENFNALSVDMSIGVHTQDETDTNDGSTEAAITLLTMGDLVLQSEISTESSDVGVSVLPDVNSKHKSHIPFNPDNANHKIVNECQELSSPVISIPPSSLEENKIVLEEQSTKEEIVLMEKVKEKTTSTRNTTSEMTNNLRMRSRFVKPKPNLRKILGTNRMGAHQELPSLFVTKGKEVEIQRETEHNALKATVLEDENLGSVTTAERKEQSSLAHVHGVEETNILQEASLTERKEDQEQGSQEVQLLSFAPTVSSETGSHTLGSGRELGENSIGETRRKDLNEDTVLTLYVPECTPASIPEVQPESIINPQDLAANLVDNVHRDGEDEQAFILTLVEIPTNAVEEFTDTTTQLMPNPFLPAPILVKSVTAEGKGDMSMSFPVTSVGQDAECLSNSGNDDSEKPSINMDPVSRKRFHCRLDESDHVPLAKKSFLASRGNCQKYSSEVCSKELINIFEETGKSYKGQDTFATLGSTYTTPEPQKEQLEPTLQCAGYTSLVKIIDTHTDKTVPQLPQNKMIVSDKEPTCTASKSEQVDNITSSSKTPLSRPGRRPLGFLSLICSKSSLESDEPTRHVRSRKRLTPLIPASRQNSKRSKPGSEGQKKIKETSDLPPSPSVVNTQSEDIGSSATQVSCDHSLPKEECKHVQKRALEKEPTTVSEYFFNDIFIEVDEIE
ncbi:transcription factor TFIIIB component B'' homolog isoform X2 [Saccopteryx bilineata]|uniref:transcription factor TFIIIB component B'' homolog isoform X2 n=1 Tax=Saccopteryx bilineata TaxID=59482 RepID=UPI00338DBFC6